MTVEERASRVRLLLFDVDGVLTDGIVVVHSDGSESKRFHIRDGAAIVWAQRAAQLAVRYVQQGVADKREALDHILRDASLGDEAVAYMGDDLLDLPLLRRAGLAAAPADAAPEVRACAHWVSARAGGEGAVRELIELVLRAQGRWSDVLAEYGGDR